MGKEHFLLVSLKEEKAKKLAQVVTNESCRKILEYLSEKNATETELSEKLNIPISTVHYNIQQLLEAGLVTAEEYHYSKKGKEVNHYKLANKYIIIAPKSTWGIKEKLKGILPVALFIAAATASIQFFSKNIKTPFTQIFTNTKETLVRDTIISSKQAIAPTIAEKAVEEVETAAASGATDALSQAASEVVTNTTEYFLKPEVTQNIVPSPVAIWSNIALWFLIGALFTITLYFIVDFIKHKKK